MATTSPTTCCATRPTRRSARRSDGCCTGASRRASNCSMRTARTWSRLSSRSSMRAVGYYRRPAEIAADRFAHAEAIRLHKKALSIVRDLAPGKDRDSQELAVLEGLAAPLKARYGYSSPELEQTLERSIHLAGSLGRTGSRVSGMVALWGTQFVQGRTADGYR